jgi:hypothetical protein
MLQTCAPPISLDRIAARVRASSNFRFSWQFFRSNGVDIRSAGDIHASLAEIVSNSNLHAFLRSSFVDMYAPEFTIDTPHEHSEICSSPGKFEDVLARAANDHLGAYSTGPRDSTEAEMMEISHLFGALGDYHSYELRPGNSPDCPICRQHNSHLFTSWFYDVAWDWCFFVAWPAKDILWMGCLTDTD